MKVDMLLFWHFLLYVYMSNATESNRTCMRKQNIGGNKTVTIYYCCKNYYEKNNSCVECSKGSTSINGSCVLCPETHYGIRCSKVCDCLTQQRCDRVYGCVDMTTVYQTESTATKAFWKTSPAYFTTNDIALTTSQSSTHDKGSNSPNDISHSKVIYLLYIGLPTFVLVIFSVIYKLIKHRSLLSSDNNTTETNRNNVELSEHMYHTIDDDVLVDTNTDNILLRMQSAPSVPSSSPRVSNTSSYLQDFCSEHTSHQSNDLSTGDKKITEPIFISSNSSSSGGIVESFGDESGYLHPYCSLYSPESDSRTYSEVKYNVSLPEGSKENSVSGNSDRRSDTQTDCNLLKSVGNKADINNDDKDNMYINTNVFSSS